MNVCVRVCLLLWTLWSSRCVYVCVFVCECEATPINTVMSHHNFNHTAGPPENSLSLNQSVVFTQANRSIVNGFIEIAL